jgi:hypothetical protein
VVVLSSINHYWANGRYLPSQLRFQRKPIAQRAAYLVLPGFAPLLRRARPVVAPAPLRCAVALVAAHRCAGVHLCVPLSSHLQLLCLVDQWPVTDFWHPGDLESEFLPGIMSLIFGSLVGQLKGILVIRRLLWWVIGSAIAWGVGYPLGEQFLASLLWHGSTPFPQAATWLVVGTTWGIIGAITGGVVVWVGRARVRIR